MGQTFLSDSRLHDVRTGMSVLRVPMDKSVLANIREFLRSFVRRLPLAVANFATDPQHRLVGGSLQLP